MAVEITLMRARHVAGRVEPDGRVAGALAEDRIGLGQEMQTFFGRDAREVADAKRVSPGSDRAGDDIRPD